MATSNRLSRLRKSVRHLTSPKSDSESKGCDLCQFGPDSYCFHYHSLEKWSESAAKGCTYCQLVVLVARDIKENHGVDITDDWKSRIGVDVLHKYDTGRVYIATTLVFNDIGR